MSSWLDSIFMKIIVGSHSTMRTPQPTKNGAPLATRVARSANSSNRFRRGWGWGMCSSIVRSSYPIPRSPTPWAGDWRDGERSGLGALRRRQPFQGGVVLAVVHGRPVRASGLADGVFPDPQAIRGSDPDREVEAAVELAGNGGDQ